MRPRSEVALRSLAALALLVLVIDETGCRSAPSTTRFVEQQDAVVEVVLAEVGAFPDAAVRIERALQSRFERVRMRAELTRARLQARGEWPRGEVADRPPAALPRLDSSDPLERQRAALSMGGSSPGVVPDETNVRELLDLLGSEQDERVRWALVWALGKLAPDRPEVRAALLPLRCNSSSWTAAFAARAIEGAPGFKWCEPELTPCQLPNLDLLRRILPPSLRNSKAEIRIADRGELVIELFAFEAPLHVAAFVQLAEEGFFSGARIARVDPFLGVFLLQAKTATRLPDERWPRPCMRGCIISADGAPGSLLVARLPIPEADGRVTVWGRVSLGMDVVDKLREGDRIERVRILNPMGRPIATQGGASP